MPRNHTPVALFLHYMHFTMCPMCSMCSNGHDQSNKRKGSGDTGERGSTKKRRTRTAEEEEAERLRQEIAKLEAEIQGLEQRSSTTTAHGTVSTPPSAVSRGATKNRTHTPRSAPPPPQPTEVDVLWDDEDYDDDDEVDVGGFSVPSNGTSRPSRAKRTPRPSNRYSTFDTQVPLAYELC